MWQANGFQNEQAAAQLIRIAQIEWGRPIEQAAILVYATGAIAKALFNRLVLLSPLVVANDPGADPGFDLVFLGEWLADDWLARITTPGALVIDFGFREAGPWVIHDPSRSYRRIRVIATGLDAASESQRKNEPV